MHTLAKHICLVDFRILRQLTVSFDCKKNMLTTSTLKDRKETHNEPLTTPRNEGTYFSPIFFGYALAASPHQSTAPLAVHSPASSSLERILAHPSGKQAHARRRFRPFLCGDVYLPEEHRCEKQALNATHRFPLF